MKHSYTTRFTRLALFSYLLALFMFPVVTQQYQDQRTSHAQQVPPPVGPPSPARHSSLSVPGTVPSLPAGQMGGIGPGGQSASYGPANPPPANGTPSPPGPPDVPGQPPSPGMVSSPPVGHQQQHPNARFFFFFFGSICIPAYSSANKPGRSYEPLHLGDIRYGVPRVKRQKNESE
jgi:hypothetical protein